MAGSLDYSRIKTFKVDNCDFGFLQGDFRDFLQYWESYQCVEVTVRCPFPQTTWRTLKSEARMTLVVCLAINFADTIGESIPALFIALTCPAEEEDNFMTFGTDAAPTDISAFLHKHPVANQNEVGKNILLLMLAIILLKGSFDTALSGPMLQDLLKRSAPLTAGRFKYRGPFPYMRFLCEFFKDDVMTMTTPLGDRLATGLPGSKWIRLAQEVYDDMYKKIPTLATGTKPGLAALLFLKDHLDLYPRNKACWEQFTHHPRKPTNYKEGILILVRTIYFENFPDSYEVFKSVCIQCAVQIFGAKQAEESHRQQLLKAISDLWSKGSGSIAKSTRILTSMTGSTSIFQKGALEPLLNAVPVGKLSSDNIYSEFPKYSQGLNIADPPLYTIGDIYDKFPRLNRNLLDGPNILQQLGAYNP